MKKRKEKGRWNCVKSHDVYASKNQSHNAWKTLGITLHDSYCIILYCNCIIYIYIKYGYFIISYLTLDDGYQRISYRNIITNLLL